MRAILIIVLLVVILGLVGWLQFSSPDGDPTIRVNTDKVKQDTSAIIEKSKQTINRASDNTDQSDPVTE